MIPVRTLELRAGHRVETAAGMATVAYVAPYVGGGYVVALQLADGSVEVAHNVNASATWAVALN